MAIERRFPAPPIHPLAALATVALDGFFSVFEVLDPFMLLFISAGIGLLGFAATTFVQRYVANDRWGAAIAKGLVMGIFAGVPYPVTGTVIGSPLLVWAGVYQWVRLPSSGNNQIVDSVIQNAHAPALEEKENE